MKARDEIDPVDERAAATHPVYSAEELARRAKAFQKANKKQLRAIRKAAGLPAKLPKKAGE